MLLKQIDSLHLEWAQESISNKLSSDANAAHTLSNKNLNKRSTLSNLHQTQVVIFHGVK